MVLADLGRKITLALRSLSNATIINEEVGECFFFLRSPWCYRKIMSETYFTSSQDAKKMLGLSAISLFLLLDL